MRNRIALLLVVCAVVWQGLGVEAVGGSGSDEHLIAYVSTLAIDNRVAVTFSNFGYLDYVHNWLYFAASAGVTNYVIFALDERTHTNLTAAGAHSFFDPELPNLVPIADNLPTFGSEPFRKIVTLKPRLVLRLLNAGFHVLLSDADIVFLSNPFHYGSGFMAQTDAHQGNSMGTYPYFANSGFVYMESLDVTKALMADMVYLLATNPDRMDQDAMNTAMAFWKHPEIPLQFSFFPTEYFPNGWVYFARHVPQRMGITPVIIHNNWADGDDKDAIKQYRFREHLLWTRDPDEYFNPGIPLITFSHTPHNDLGLELHALECALAIATMFNRIVVLPNFYCGYGFTDCTADAFLRIENLFASFRVREHSFLDNPRRAPEFKDVRVAHVLIKGHATDEAMPEVKEGDTLLVIEPDNLDYGLTQAELVDKLGPVHTEQIIHFHGMAHRFQHFVNPQAQLHHEWSMRKGLVYSDYVNNAARGIAAKLTRNFVCVHIPSPELAEPVAAFLESRLHPRTRMWLPFFTDMRTEDGLAPVLGPMRQRFPLLRYLNASLDYPLCDLFRLGDHPTLWAVEEVVCGQAAQFYHVADVPQSSYAKRVCQRRAELGEDCHSIHLPASGTVPKPAITTVDAVAAEQLPPGDLDEDGTAPAVASSNNDEQGEVVGQGELKQYRTPLICPGFYMQDAEISIRVGEEYNNREFKGMAKQCFAQASLLNPRSYLALALLAAMEIHFEMYESAIEHLIAASEIEPSEPAVWVNLGLCLQEGDSPEMALEAYTHALDLKPDFAAAYFNLGRAYTSLKRHDNALPHYLKASQLRPSDFPVAYVAAARAYSSLGRVKEAEESYKKAIATSPPASAADSYNELGRLFRDSERYEESAEAYRTAITLQPHHAMAYSNLGAVTMEIYQRVIGFRYLGKVDEDTHKFNEVHGLISKAIEIDPGCSTCYAQLADNLKEMQYHKAAIEAYETSIELDPKNYHLKCLLYYSRYFTSDWTDYDAKLREIEGIVDMQLDPAFDQADTQCMLPLQAVLYPVDPWRLLAVTKQFVKSLLNKQPADFREPLPLPLPEPVVAAPHRLRLAYISADFKDHPVAKRMQEHFRFHNRARYEVIAYSLNKDDGSSYRAKIDKDVERFVDLSDELNPRTIAQRINSDGVQILVDLMGHTRASDLITILCAYKPAPYQSHHMGYAGTMGAPFIPTILTDRTASPPDYRAHYTEALLYLPMSLFATDYRHTYPAMVDTPLHNPEKLHPNRPNELPPGSSKFLFCAFNSLQKIDPLMFGMWMRVLHRVPDSILWMLRMHHSSSEANLVKEASAAGIDPARLVFTPSMDDSYHLHVKNLADVFFDTLTYGAHSSGADILWAGVPMLTLPGEKMGNRLPSGLLRASRLPYLAMRSLQDYEDTAVFLASHPRTLRHLRERLHEGRTLTGGLYDTATYVSDYEKALIMGWEAKLSSDGGLENGQHYHIIVAR